MQVILLVYWHCSILFWLCSILHGISGQWCSTFSGCHVTEAASFFQNLAANKELNRNSNMLTASTTPFAVSSTQAGGVDRQEFDGAVEPARHWRRVELWSPELHYYLLFCFRPTSNVEFESDSYRGVLRARCYPFDMAQNSFPGKNLKVCQLPLH